MDDDTAQGWAKFEESPSEVFALSPDGTTMVTAPIDGKIRLKAFETESGKSKFQIPADKPLKAAFIAMSFSPDGTQLVYSDLTKTVTLFDMAKGKIQSTLEVDRGRVFAAASFDGGKKVAAVLERRMVEWDVASRRITQSKDTNEAFGNDLAVSADGRWWALSVEQRGEQFAGRTMLWDRKLNDGWHRLSEIRTVTNKMAFTPDSNRLLTISASGFLRIWKLDK